MKQSYKIKHDFLFDSENLNFEISHLDSDQKDIAQINLTDVLNVTRADKFLKLIDLLNNNILIKDDIGKCVNPASERYKQFIIRCIARKIIDLSKNVYL